MAPTETADRVLLGRVIGLWGVQGWVRIYSDTQPSDAIFNYQPWYLGDNDQAFRVLDWRRQGPRLMARLEGVDEPDQASSLIEQAIQVDRRIMPKPEKGRYYWSDLIGLAVVNRDEHCFGSVHRLIETGANDVIDARDEQGRSTLIPFVSGQYVLDVDLESGTLTVDWPLAWAE